jgi:hypothetical protein
MLVRGGGIDGGALPFGCGSYGYGTAAAGSSVVPHPEQRRAMSLSDLPQRGQD